MSSDPTKQVDTEIKKRLITLGPFYDNINLYYLLAALSTFYDTKTKTFKFDDTQIDVLTILDPFRVKSPEFLEKDTHLIIYECCAALTDITPKFAKMLQEMGAYNESTIYQFELTDFVTWSGSIYSKGIPYQLYPDEIMSYYAIGTETDIQNEPKKLKTTANFVGVTEHNGFPPRIGPIIPRDVFMLFTFDETPENLYNRIVEAFIKAFIKEAPTFLTELTKRINSTKIAILQKISKNGPIREALTRNDNKLISFDSADSRFKEILPNTINGNVLVSQALRQPGTRKNGRSRLLGNILVPWFTSSKGGKKSIKRNKIRGSKSKLRRRSSVRRKKTTRRKHN